MARSSAERAACARCCPEYGKGRWDTMLVFINDREIGAFSNEAATVGEVVDALRVHVDPSEVMTAVEVDGEVFSAGDESRYARRLARNIDRLVIATSPPRELARAMQ